VRGIEFAELADGQLYFGLKERRPAREHRAQEIERLAAELEPARSEAGDREHPLYRQFPEAWLESPARDEIGNHRRHTPPQSDLRAGALHSRAASAA
jgi:hypothetical protein